MRLPAGVLVLLALALVVRVGLVAATPGYTLRDDGADYPVFAGAVYALAGFHPNAVRLAQALLGALGAGLAGLLTRGRPGGGARGWRRSRSRRSSRRHC